MARRFDGGERPHERVAVIGLGRFGGALARTLHDLGNEVTALDLDDRLVAEVADGVTLAAQGDGADEALLRSLQIDRSDVAVVAQGENLESSVLSTMLLKTMGVPWVIARARNRLHGDLLRRIGADRVLFPEADAGFRLAHALPVRSIEDYIPLSASAGVVKLDAPAHFAGRAIGELCAGREAHLSVLLIRRGGTLIASPASEERIESGDELVLAGADGAIVTFLRDDRSPPAGPPR